MHLRVTSCKFFLWVGNNITSCKLLFAVCDLLSTSCKFKEITLRVPKLFFTSWTFKMSTLLLFCNLVITRLVFVVSHTNKTFDYYVWILYKKQNNLNRGVLKQPLNSRFRLNNATSHHCPPPPTTIHHHQPPPTKMHSWQPTITQKMDHHPAKAKIYPYITSFWHCFKFFFLRKYDSPLRDRDICVTKFWSVLFPNSKFLLHFTILKIF